MGLILPLPLAKYKALHQRAFNWGQISKFVCFANAVTLISASWQKVRLPLARDSAPHLKPVCLSTDKDEI